MSNVIYISGGSGAVGRAVADRVQSDGNLPVLFHRRLDNDIQHAQVELDVRDDCTDAIRRAEHQYGIAQHAIVASGVAVNGPAMMLSDRAFADVIDVNLTGAFRFVRPLLRPMWKRRSGTITFISSVSAFTGSPGQSNYAASKAGMSGLMKSLAQEMGPYGVRVNSVIVGLLDGGMATGISKAARTQIISRTPLRREGSASDVAACVGWLISDAACHVSGAEIPVTGGFEIG